MITSVKSLSSRRYLKEFVCKRGPNCTSIDPSEKKMFMDYQPIVLLVEVAVRLSLKIRSLYKTYTWGYKWRP